MAIRKVFFAKITRAPQMRLDEQGFHADILRALDPDLKYEFHRRTWRMSQPETLGNRYVAAKLGFTHEGVEEVVLYDEARHDFITNVAMNRETHFSHFVIDTRTEIVAFEERGAVITRDAFLRAFRELLSKAGFKASVAILPDTRTLQEWADDVDRVTQVHAVIFRPNPGYSEDAGAFRQLLEESGAEVADVTAKDLDGEGINIRAGWIRGAAMQIAQHGQGRLSARGLRGERIRSWTSEQQARMDSIDEDAEDDSRSIAAKLLGRLREIYDR